MNALPVSCKPQPVNPLFSLKRPLLLFRGTVFQEKDGLAVCTLN